MDVDSQWTEHMKWFAPAGALAFKQAGADRARWIYEEIDLARARKESPQLVVLVGSHTTRAEIAAELLLVGPDADRAVRVELAEALIGGGPLGEVFEVARRLELTEVRRSYGWLRSLGQIS
jgi:hypothetical protein